MSEYQIFLYLNNLPGAAEVQTAFQWPADWVLDPMGEGDNWVGCRSNQITTRAPKPGTSGGPIDGTLTTSFDCFQGPGIFRIGYMHFRSGQSGCLFQVRSAFPFGNHYVDCSHEIPCEFDPNHDTHTLQFGSICIGTPGRDACIVIDPQPDGPPTCDAGGPYSGAVGEQIQFDGRDSGDVGYIVSWDWDFGDGHVGSGSTPTHVYAVPDLYTVTLEVADNCYNPATCQTTADIQTVPLEPTTWGQIKSRARH